MGPPIEMENGNFTFAKWSIEFMKESDKNGSFDSTSFQQREILLLDLVLSQLNYYLTM